MSNTKKNSNTSCVSPILRVDQVAELLGCSIKHIHNLQKAGKLPPRIRVSDRVIGWRENEIEAWLSSNREEDSDD
jgi:predicted DNA-binding transcriptional regulator AlpA